MKRFAILVFSPVTRKSYLKGFVRAINAPDALLRAYRKYGPKGHSNRYARHAWGDPATDPNHYTRATRYAGKLDTVGA